MLHKLSFISLAAILFLLLTSLIVRHDVSDDVYVELGKKYPQIVHFIDGEGTLVASDWVLTAAHIATFVNEDFENPKYRSVKCDGKIYEIEKIVIHPEYQLSASTINHDIALVKLRTPVSDVEPVEINATRDEPGKVIILVGSGDRGTGLTGPVEWDKIVRAATNRIDEVSAQWLSFDFDKPDAKDVTKYEGVSGPGDSGGPALIEDNGKLIIVGVSSHQQGGQTYGIGRYGVVEFYARVSSYKEWIENYIK